MLNRKIITIFLLLSITFLTSCYFDQYRTLGTFTIKAEFPGIRSSVTGRKAKPVDAAIDYVPGFIDRIDVVLTDTDGNVYTSQSRRSPDSQYSSAVEVPSVQYSDNYSIQITAFTCNSKSFGECDDETDTIHKWIVTHIGSNESTMIDFSLGNPQISVNLSIESQKALDETPLSYPFEHSELLSAHFSGKYLDEVYCMALDESGRIGFSWFSPENEQLKIKILDSHGFDLTETITISNAKSSVRLSCIYMGGRFLVPFSRQISGNKLIVGQIDNNLISSEIAIPTDTAWKDNPILYPYITNNSNIIGIAYVYETFDYNFGRSVFQIFDKSLENLSDHNENEFLAGQSLSPSITIIDDNHYLIAAYEQSNNALRAHIVNSENEILTDILKAIGPEGPFSPHPFHYHILTILDDGYENLPDIAFTLSYLPLPLAEHLENISLTPSLDLDDQTKKPYKNFPGITRSFSQKKHSNYLLSAIVQNPAGDSRFDIYYSDTSIDSDYVESLTKVHDFSSNIDVGKPLVDINEDGLAVISWVGVDSSDSNPDNWEYRIYFKRYLFPI